MQLVRGSHAGVAPIDADDRSASRAESRSSAASTEPVSNAVGAPAHDFSHVRAHSQVSQTESDHAALALKQFSANAAAFDFAQRQHEVQRPDVDPSLNRTIQYQPQYPHHHQQLSHPYGALSNDLNGYQSTASSRPVSGHVPADARARTDTPQLGPNNTGTDVEKKDKKGPSATAANEKELRELLERNTDRDLISIAKEVRTADRSQKAERAKQLYAMRWLQRFCRQGKDSVPRNRVYTHYAQRCGTDRVDTLNPASFGKLVRIIFPGIQTRRLGQRGESKYHYVNLILVDESEAMASRTSEMHERSFHDFHGDSMDNSEHLMSSRFPADSSSFPTAFPVPEGSFDQSHFSGDGNPQSRGLLFADIQHPQMQHDGEAPRMISQHLKFASSSAQNLADQPLTLPDIEPFLPPNTDVDLANALTALYRTHCTSLMDAMRFVREKGLFRLFSTFAGTLTVPVTRLFTAPSIAPWITLCDWHVYQQIIRFVSQLALQVIPGPVWTLLHRVANELTEHINTNFSHYPPHVLRAKAEPATVFSKLLQRLLRVNETAHAAANLLLSDDMRNMMWNDWVKTVRPKRVVETELPACGYEQVTAILTNEIRSLLEPLDESLFEEEGTDFENAKYAQRNSPERVPTSADVVERWATFLKGLPARFPQAQTRGLLHSINAIGSGALRDITVGQCQSFGSWWITKCWIDEMMLWLAEMGGFLESRPAVLVESPQQSPGLESIGEGSHGESRHSTGGPPNGLGVDLTSGGPYFAPIQNGGRRSSGPPTATFGFPTKVSGKGAKRNFAIHEDDYEDSGIGMSLLSNEAFEYETQGVTAH